MKTSRILALAAAFALLFTTSISAQFADGTTMTATIPTLDSATFTWGSIGTTPTLDYTLKWTENGNPVQCSGTLVDDPNGGNTANFKETTGSNGTLKVSVEKVKQPNGKFKYTLTITGAPSCGWDKGTNAKAGQLKNSGTVYESCLDAQASATVANVGDSISLDAAMETIEMRSGVLDFAWSQTSGTAVTLSNSATANASFTVPSGSEGETLEFEVEMTWVYDSTSVTETVSVFVDIPLF